MVDNQFWCINCTETICEQCTKNAWENHSGGGRCTTAALHRAVIHHDERLRLVLPLNKLFDGFFHVFAVQYTIFLQQHGPLYQSELLWK
jgi:hypothetical protein